MSGFLKKSVGSIKKRISPTQKKSKYAFGSSMPRFEEPKQESKPYFSPSQKGSQSNLHVFPKNGQIEKQNIVQKVDDNLPEIKIPPKIENPETSVFKKLTLQRHSSRKRSEKIMQHFRLLQKLQKFGNLTFPGDPNRYEIKREDFLGIETISNEHNVELYHHIPTKREIVFKFLRLPSPKEFASDEKKWEKVFNRWYAEIETHQRVSDHPNVIDFYGFFFHNNFLFICMEKMDGSLKDLYQEFHNKINRFPEELIGVISASTLNAMARLRKEKIMHRDLKPENILYNMAGEIKIADFGIARLVENSLANSYIGTELYMPPEFFKEKTLAEPYNSNRDVFSLGMTLVELAFGNIPYDIDIYNPETRWLIPHLVTETLTEELLMKCMKSKISHKALDFIKSCIDKEKMTRPKPDGLVKTEFYQDYAQKLNKEYVSSILDCSYLVVQGDRTKYKLEDEVKSLTEQLKKANKEIKRLEEYRIPRPRERISQKDQEIQQLTKSNMKRKAISEPEDDMHKKQRSEMVQVASLQAEITRLNDENIRLKKDLAVIKQVLDQKDVEISQLKDKVDVAETMVHIEKEKLQITHEAFSAELSDAKTCNESLRGMLNNKDIYIAALQKEKDMLVHSNNELKSCQVESTEGDYNNTKKPSFVQQLVRDFSKRFSTKKKKKNDLTHENDINMTGLPTNLNIPDKINMRRAEDHFNRSSPTRIGGYYRDSAYNSDTDSVHTLQASGSDTECE